MADLQRIGRALQGFGAGYNGQGAQFQRALAMEREAKRKSQANSRANSIQRFYGASQLFKSGDFEGAHMLLMQGDENHQFKARELQAAAGDPAAMAELGDEFNRFESRMIAAGEIEAPKKSSETMAFEEMTKGMDPADVEKARRIELGLDARAVGSAAQTIANNGTANKVAESQSVIAQGEESGKQKAILKFRPKIAKAVKLAEKEAAARGETLTALKRSEAAYPGLIDAVDQLKELAPIATSTLAGRAWDAIVKESGFGATKGRDSRTKFVAIINNQMLPLLRETFGAAFTFQEGESLKATMGDPDSSPTEKVIALEAFIAQKQRDIQSKQRELDQPETDFSDDIIEVDF